MSGRASQTVMRIVNRGIYGPVIVKAEDRIIDGNDRLTQLLPFL